VRPDIFIYALAAAFVAVGIIISYVYHYQIVGIILFLMGVFMFLLPSMRKPRR
jgi:hypothetical protein